MLAISPQNLAGARALAWPTIRAGSRAAEFVRRLSANIGKQDTAVGTADISATAGKASSRF
jgi:hypothetical protein